MRYLKSEQDANLPSVGAPQAVPTEGAADEDEATTVAGLRNDTDALLFFPAAAAACVAALLVDIALYS